MKFQRRLFLPVLGVFAMFVSFAVVNSYGQGGTVSICHVTGSETNPSFELTSIPEQALNGHLQHGDIYPVPAAGCPSGVVVATPTPAPAATPEPITILLFGSGLAATGFAVRRARRKKLEDLDR